MPYMYVVLTLSYPNKIDLQAQPNNEVQVLLSV